MTDFRVPLLDSEDQIPAKYLERAPAGSAAGGGPRSADFGFSGELVVRTGVQYWLSPNTATVAQRLTATLGTLPTAGIPSNVTFRLMVNGAPIASVTVVEKTRSGVSTTFTVADIPAGSFVSVDIVGVPASTPSKAADAVVQLWWSCA